MFEKRLQRCFCLNCHTCWSHDTVLSNHICTPNLISELDIQKLSYHNKKKYKSQQTKEGFLLLKKWNLNFAFLSWLLQQTVKQFESLLKNHKTLIIVIISHNFVQLKGRFRQQLGPDPAANTRLTPCLIGIGYYKGIYQKSQCASVYYRHRGGHTPSLAWLSIFCNYPPQDCSRISCHQAPLFPIKYASREVTLITRWTQVPVTLDFHWAVLTSHNTTAPPFAYSWADETLIFSPPGIAGGITGSYPGLHQEILTYLTYIKNVSPWWPISSLILLAQFWLCYHVEDKPRTLLGHHKEIVKTTKRQKRQMRTSLWQT